MKALLVLFLLLSTAYAQDEEYAPTDQTLSQNDLQVQIQSVKVDFVNIKSFGSTLSKDKLLVISLKIKNNSNSKIINFQGWSAKELDFDSNRARIKDDHDNHYKRIHFGLGSKIDGQVNQPESIYPQKDITDVLVFEPPVNNANILFLELPAEQFGGEGSLKFKITREFFDQELIQKNKEERIQKEFKEVEQLRKEQILKKLQQEDLARWKTWKSNDGKFSVYAKFLRANNGNVYLQKEDGKEIKVKKEDLSSQDLKWINQRTWKK